MAFDQYQGDLRPRLANRIAVASETSAIQLAALFKSLSPETQTRANAAVNDILRSN